MSEVLESFSVPTLADAHIVWQRRARHDVSLIRDCTGTTSYFVKRCGAPTIAGEVSLRGEALFHAQLQVGELPSELRDRVPRMLERTSGDATLIFQGLPDHVNLRDCIFSEDTDLRELCAVLGDTVSLLHRSSGTGFPRLDCPDLMPETCTPEALAHGPRGYSEFLRALQGQPEILDGLRELHSSWHADALVHGDLKIDNVLVRGRAASPVIVDWELSGIGDRRWEIGTFVGSLMFAWLESLTKESHRAEDRRTLVLDAVSEFYRHATADFPEASSPATVRIVFAWAGSYLLDVVLASLPLGNGRIPAVGMTALHLASQLITSHGSFLTTGMEDGV